MSVSEQTEHETIEIPRELPVMVLEDNVVFPMAAVPLRVVEEWAIKLVDDVARGEGFIGLVTRKEDVEPVAPMDGAYMVGTVARILQLQRLPDGQQNIVVQALQRFRVNEILQQEPYPMADIKLLASRADHTEKGRVLAATLKRQVVELIELSPNIPDAATTIVENIDDPGLLSDLVASNLNVSVSEKQGLLETLSERKRMEKLVRLVGRELEFSEASQKIREDVKSTIDKGQREFFLRQQMRAIRQELGEGEDSDPQIREYREKIAALQLPEEVEREAVRQVARLEKMNDASGEFHVVTTYLDWIVDLPWNTTTDDHLDIKHAREILDRDHHGLEKVKRRILEYLSVRKLRADAAGPILCFVGPPGVGKTSLGKSIAAALNRSFHRMALGGIRDEAEIRGHRMTYVGAMPGRIIQGMKRAESNNPVFMLDEIDKLGSDFRGDPSSALLEVLDPAQNSTFTDNYLNVPFDLSKTMFIATANILDTIPWALRDRMEIIEIPGYTLEEKFAIARKYLVPRQLKEHGLTKSKVRFSVKGLRTIIESYTREAGVRNLEREIANVCRGCAHKLVSGEKGPISIHPENLPEYLGQPRFDRDVAERTAVPGVVTGLAYTPVGGDILFVEASSMPGKGGLVLTGQLGDVMKESATAAMTYIRANAEKLGLGDEDFSKLDLHVHVPGGAIPKDGPSAGVTMLTAITSLLLGKKVKSHFAMTGEITLRGQVLPVGGIKEKVLAAVQAGIKDVILPDRCRKDLEDIPESARKKVRFHFVSRMEEVLNLALNLKLDVDGKD